MALPKFGPKVFRNAALGLSALAMASLPFAAPSSAGDDNANQPTISAPAMSGQGLSMTNAHRAVLRDTPRTEAAPQGQAVKTEIADTTQVAYTSPIYGNVTEARRAAQEYVRETGGLGFIISYGEFENAIDPQELGRVFQQQITQRGAESRYFIGHNDTPGVAMAFFNGHTIEGPMGPREAASSISDIVGQHLFYKRQLGSLTPEAGEPTLAAISQIIYN
ncbi:hypothetical protein JCM17846_28760 [Iodidimonas nitroreducens]|uniref:Uncharacterized protein n=1 Tax=Iodidimonas nitroreducens TaxID=1236968 RepID=A0A5A7NBW1_9PROT|nr:hypothetical protein [Iodidimonas nitroreducens]GER05194.1 hypothetical protein JCM17846_28760 [Iodidimonas nitroreducens]